MLLGGDFAHGLRIAAVAVGGQAGAARAAIHGGYQHGRCAAQAGFVDVDAEVILVGGFGIDVGLRPTCFGIVVGELDEEVVALLHLAEDLVQAEGVGEGLQRLAGLRVVGDRDASVEEYGQDLAPAYVAAAVAVGDGGVAGDEDGGDGGGGGDLDRAQRGVRAD